VKRIPIHTPWPLLMVVGLMVFGIGGWLCGVEIGEEGGRAVMQSQVDSLQAQLAVDHIAYYDSGRRAGHLEGWADCCLHFGLTEADTMRAVSDPITPNEGR